MPIAEVRIPQQPDGALSIAFESGRSIVFVGANGSGKTRLGVQIEKSIAHSKVVRIAAHRSLAMNDKISGISFERAKNALRTGYADGGDAHKEVRRWQGRPAVALLTDFEFLLQALFAEHSNAAVKHLAAHLEDRNREPPVTVLSRLKGVWERLLPHRKLVIKELSVDVIPSNGGAEYAGSEMSDGERVIFYLLGHCLLAEPASVIIIDEPELHIHKAILAALWDAIEGERPDCSFVFITHDLDFVVARPSASKFVVTSFDSGRWKIESLPHDAGLPERVVSELVGSRQPILFVEGERGSLDLTMYRGAYPNFLIHAVGACDIVIHTVASFRNNGQLHRLGSVCGCVDSDHRSPEEVKYLNERGVFVLPVAEVENILALPEVFIELAREHRFGEEDTESRLAGLTKEVCEQANNDIDAVSVRFAVRRLDAEVKRIAPNAKSILDLQKRFTDAVQKLDVAGLATSFKKELEQAIAANDLRGVLKLYDNKGIASLVAKYLGLKGARDLAEWVSRLLGGSDAKQLKAAIAKAVPPVKAE